METVLPRAIGAPLGHPGRSLRCPRPPRTLRSRRARPDTHERPLLCGRRQRQLLCSRRAPALSLPTARCRRARAGLAGAGSRRGTGASGADATFLVGSSCQLFSSHAVDRCAPTSTSLPCPPARGLALQPYRLPPLGGARAVSGRSLWASAHSAPARTVKRFGTVSVQVRAARSVQHSDSVLCATLVCISRDTPGTHRPHGDLYRDYTT